MLKYLFSLLLVLACAGCGKKAVKSDPVVEAAMNTVISCIKCGNTAPRTSFSRRNQVLVQCPKCRKVFPFHKGLKKGPSGK